MFFFPLHLPFNYLPHSIHYLSVEVQCLDVATLHGLRAVPVTSPSLLLAPSELRSRSKRPEFIILVTLTFFELHARHRSI